MAALNARGDFLYFLGYAGRDERGRPFEVRPLDRFLWTWVEEVWDLGYNAGVMLPVESGKTTQFAWRIAWEIGCDPNLLVSLVTAAHDDSCERVSLVRGILDLPEYRRVFPEVEIGARDSTSAFTLRRGGHSHSPTVGGHGVITGEGVRAHLLMLDDVCNQKNTLHEPVNRVKVLKAVRGTWMSRLKARGSTPPRAAWVQTSFHDEDAAAVTRKDPESGWAWLVVRAEPPFEALGYEDWRLGELLKRGTIPLHWPREVLERKWRDMGPPHNVRGMANRPVADAEQPFSESYLDGPKPIGTDRYVRRVLFADPAGDATKAARGNPDWCAVVAIGLRPDGRWEVFRATRLRGTPSEQASFIAAAVLACRPHAAWQETVKDETLLHFVNRKIRELGGKLRLKPVYPTTNKILRIRDTLEPALAAGDLEVCGERFPELKAEMIAFPAGGHDDMVDALAAAYAKVRATGPMRHRSGGADPKEPEEEKAEAGGGRKSRFRTSSSGARGSIFGRAPRSVFGRRRDGA